jgi:hypothetical protein
MDLIGRPFEPLHNSGEPSLERSALLPQHALFQSIHPFERKRRASAFTDKIQSITRFVHLQEETPGPVEEKGILSGSRAGSYEAQIQIILVGAQIEGEAPAVPGEAKMGRSIAPAWELKRAVPAREWSPAIVLRP